MEPIYVIWLARVSSDKQWRYWDSPEIQAEAIRRSVEGRGEILLKVFKEHYTGTKINRPAIISAIDFIKTSEIKISKCYVYNIDRSSRWGHDVHYWIKKMFKDVWVTYLDINWVIQERKKIINIDWVNTDEYSWAYENPSEYAEEMLVMMAKNEKEKMLQRTISQEIRNTKNWYHQRQAHFWLKNIKILTSEWKYKTIEVDDPIESVWVKKIFELRSIWIPDEDIVKEVNLLGFKNRLIRRVNKMEGWTCLDVKYLQRLVKNVVYAGIKVEKWTWNLPIKIPYINPYKSLVDINTWNYANRWLIKIIEDNNWNIEIVYSKKWNTSFEPIVEKRKSYNPDYPYSKVLKCPICNWTLTPNKSKSRNWTYHHYYQCCWKAGENWNNKHSNYSVKRDDLNSEVIKFIKSILPWNWLIQSIDYISDIYFDNISNINKSVTNDNDLKLKELEFKKQQIENNLYKYIEYPKTIEVLERQLLDIYNNIKQLKLKNLEFTGNNNIDKTIFKKFIVSTITRLETMVLNKEKPKEIESAFRFIFPEKASYEDLLSHTPKMYPIFSLQSQQKNPVLPESSFIFHWQPQLESNRPRRIWSPEF